MRLLWRSFCSTFEPFPNLMFSCCWIMSRMAAHTHFGCCWHLAWLGLMFVSEVLHVCLALECNVSTTRTRTRTKTTSLTTRALSELGQDAFYFEDEIAKTPHPHFVHQPNQHIPQQFTGLEQPFLSKALLCWIGLCYTLGLRV